MTQTENQVIYPIHPIHSCYDGVFNTGTGKLISLKNPKPEAICISDIAAALSKICRFGGHSSHFYSVAQHSVLVAALAPEWARKEALLHDAAEAYLGDVIKPLKVILGDVYAAMEERFEAAIAEKFGLKTDPEIKDLVKHFDLMALELEHEAFQKANPAFLIAHMRSFGMIKKERNYAWTHEVAHSMFLAEYFKTTV